MSTQEECIEKINAISLDLVDAGNHELAWALRAVIDAEIGRFDPPTIDADGVYARIHNATRKAFFAA